MEFRILLAAISLLLTFVTVTAENYGKCNAYYQRVSETHSACQQKNTSCKIIAHGGIDQGVKDKIIEVHNRLRSNIANQGEGTRGMPPAADMLEIEWDDELAYVAQRRADSCIYAHDPKEARLVQRFTVGQNIGKAGPAPMKLTPDWERVIQSFYDEIKLFKKSEICGDRSFNFHKIGHFTAVIWAKTFKVGCGYTQFHGADGYTELYYCNYGPGGNVDKECVYEKGPACSKCPENTECNEELGLCKRANENAVPVYPSEEQYFFNCNFRDPSSKDCGAHHIGDGKWKVARGLVYSYAEVVLQGGQNATMAFATTLTPPEDSDESQFCVALRFRKGPILAKDQANNRAIMYASPKIRGPVQLIEYGLDKNDVFFQYQHNGLLWREPTEIKISFAVPEGADPQFFDLAFVRAYDGPCEDPKDMDAN